MSKQAKTMNMYENSIPDSWEDGYTSDEAAGYSSDEYDEEPRINTFCAKKRQETLDRIKKETEKKIKDQKKQDEIDVQNFKAKATWLSEKRVDTKPEQKSSRLFPVLSSKAKKTEPKNRGWSKCTGKGNVITVETKSIINTKKQDREQSRRTVNGCARSNAFNMLENSQHMKEKLEKTKMCKSVGSGKPCRYGDKCKFAHSTEELKTKECIFGDKCKFVIKTKNGNFVNRKEFRQNDGSKKKCRVCSCKHPGETDANLFARTGITVVSPPKMKTVVLPKFSKRGLEIEKLKNQVINQKKMENDKKISNGAGWSQMMKRTQKPLAGEKMTKETHKETHKEIEKNQTLNTLSQQFAKKQVLKVPTYMKNKAFGLVRQMNSNIRLETY